MIAVYIGFIILMIVVSVIWHHYHKISKAKEFLASVNDTEEVDKISVMLYSLKICCSNLSQILSAIMTGDKIQICRVHRLFASEYDKFEHFSRQAKPTEVIEDIYLKYLWEATIKIAESGRKMVVHPEYSSNTSEIRDLVFWSNNLPNVETMALEDIAEKSRLNKEIISETIRNYSNRMSHRDYEEGSQKYSYLSFLYYLHSFMMSIDNLMKPYRGDLQ